MLQSDRPEEQRGSALRLFPMRSPRRAQSARRLARTQLQGRCIPGEIQELVVRVNLRRCRTDVVTAVFWTILRLELRRERVFLGRSGRHHEGGVGPGQPAARMFAGGTAPAVDRKKVDFIDRKLVKYFSRTSASRHSRRPGSDGSMTPIPTAAIAKCLLGDRGAL